MALFRIKRKNLVFISSYVCLILFVSLENWSFPLRGHTKESQVIRFGMCIPFFNIRDLLTCTKNTKKNYVLSALSFI